MSHPPRTYMMIHKAKFKLESLSLRAMKLLLARQSETRLSILAICTPRASSIAADLQQIIDANNATASIVEQG